THRALRRREPRATRRATRRPPWTRLLHRLRRERDTAGFRGSRRARPALERGALVAGTGPARPRLRARRTQPDAERVEALPAWEALQPHVPAVAGGQLGQNTHCVLNRTVFARMMCGSIGPNTWPPLRTQ